MKSNSGKRLAQVLESRGWILIRVNGSHHFYGHPLVPDPVNVPIHRNKDLKSKTLKAIMRAAGLTDDDLPWRRIPRPPDGLNRRILLAWRLPR